MMEYIGTILNSISIIAIGVALRRVRQVQEGDGERRLCLLNKLEENEQEIKSMGSVIREVTRDVKNMRLEITEAAPRKELSMHQFTDLWGRRIRFDDGTEFPEEYLEYVAQIALKAIASELPEEKRTHEIVENIINRIPNELGKTEMRL